MTRDIVDLTGRGAGALPSAFYRDTATFARCLDRVFARSWQFVGARELVPAPGHVHPVTLLPDSLDEPLLLSRDSTGVLHCLSNVCTHRGAVIAMTPHACKTLQCGYHGRRFALDGRFESMPRVDAELAIRKASDDLASLDLAALGNLLFTTLGAAASFESTFDDVLDRVADLPLASMDFAPELSTELEVAAHWALFVENYLEGLHIPFVHPGLAQELSVDSYTDELFESGTLQVARSRDGAGVTFEGTDIVGRYLWLFPNTMLNFYPWGLSLNVVEPISTARTRVRNYGFVHDRGRLGTGAGGALGQVDAEDVAIVERVQRGVRSRFYRGGVLCPRHERGVEHFHTMLRQALSR